MLESLDMAVMPSSGIHTVTVPGAVAGWDALRTRFGKLPFEDLLAPAILYAEDGFPVSDVIADTWGGLSDRLSGDANAAATYLPNGRAPRAGEVFKNPALAQSLRLIAREGSSAFYSGRIGDAILETSAKLGGTLGAADLSEFRPEWVARGFHDVSGVDRLRAASEYTGDRCAAHAQPHGVVSAGKLYRFQSAEALHVMIEAKKLAYADMLRYVGDPRFGTTGSAGMLDKTHASTRAQRSIRPGLPLLSNRRCWTA